MAEIYGLYDPLDGSLRYIGKANCSTKRLQSHLRDARRRTTPLYGWINGLRRIGRVPHLRVLEITDDWIEAERRHISEARARGDGILNVAIGGNEPHCPIETRRANGRKHLRRLTGLDPYPPEKLTRESLVRDVHEWALKVVARAGSIRGFVDVASKMRKYAAAEPEHFADWANAGSRPGDRG